MLSVFVNIFVDFSHVLPNRDSVRLDCFAQFFSNALIEPERAYSRQFNSLMHVRL